jgi:hypothetical protein
VIGIREVRLQKWTAGAFITIPTPQPALSLTMVYDDRALLPGINQYRAEVILANGAVVYSEIVEVVFFGDAPVLLFPNPARRGMPVKIFVHTAGVYSLQVVDANGRAIFNEALNSLGAFTVPVQLPSGLYYFIIRDKGRIAVTHKLTVL